jgi:CBS-domain-containing membrane protein
MQYNTIRYDTNHIVGYGVVESQIAYGEAVAVALTISAMTYFKVVHPPAGAYAFLYVNKGMGWKGIFSLDLLVELL